MGQASLFQVGTATVDITPSLDKTVYLAGFAPNRKAHKILHPITAGILYIKDRDSNDVCLVTLDLIGLFNPQVNAIREMVKDVIRPERVLVCSTHTHAGPDTMGLWGLGFAGIPFKSGIDFDYRNRMLADVAAGIRKAVAETVPALLHSVTFDTPEDWVRNDRKSGGAYRRAVALGVKADGKWKSVLVNFAAHPETLWDKNHELSADYPATYRAALVTEGVETPLFFSGPLGAMLTPNVNPKANLEERKQYIENLGANLAALVLRNLETSESIEGQVKFAHEKRNIACLNKGFRLFNWLGVFDRKIPDSSIDTEFAQVHVGNLKITTIPGEASPEVGHQIYEALGSGHRMVFCLGLDELGYIIPSSFWIKKEYKYEQSMSLGSHIAPFVVKTVYDLRARISSF